MVVDRAAEDGHAAHHQASSLEREQAVKWGAVKIDRLLDGSMFSKMKSNLFGPDEMFVKELQQYTTNNSCLGHSLHVETVL